MQALASGKAICKANGSPFFENVRSGKCPLRYFDGAPMPDPPKPPKPEYKPIPREQWPAWAKALAAMATDEDKGIGDVIHRKLGVLGEFFKATMSALGVPCGCDERQAQYNAEYPLDPPNLDKDNL